MSESGNKFITLIRHGQSQSQANPDVDGINPDLSPKGEQQARALANRVSDLNPDAIISSPLIRAYRTYKLSQLGAPDVTFDPRLVESDWGNPERYEGGDFPYLDDSGSLEYPGWHLRPVRERVESAIESIEASGHCRFVLFGHWGVSAEFLGAFFEVEDGARMALMENTALSTLEIMEDGKRRLIQWNDSVHVPLD